MGLTEIINERPFFIFSLFGVLILLVEAVAEITNYGVYGTLPLFYSTLPHYFMIVSAAYDVIIMIFPLLMTLKPGSAVKWGYLTAIFGAGGQYLNIGPWTGVMFIVLLGDGLAPALLSFRKSKASLRSA